MDQIAENLMSELPADKDQKASSLFPRLVPWKSLPVNTSGSSQRTSSPFDEAFAELAREFNGTQAEE